nr:unnamed protein product [Callosobruchus analis]
MKCTIKLTENKIYCSPECEAKTNDSNVERQQADIKRLELEVIEKQAYIDRLQKRARDFENDVIEVEQKYIEEQHIYKAELKNNKEQMYLLRQKIIETEETNKNLTEKIEKYLSQIKQLNIEINELKQVEVEMLNSLTVLEATNDTYVNEIERLQYGADTCDATTELEDDSKTEECVRRHSTTEVHPVSELSSSSVAENVPTTGNVSSTSFEAGPEVPINTIQRKKKIIIYGDEYAINFRKSLDMYIGNSFQVDAFVKPNIEFSALTKNLFQHVVSLQEDDYFIVMISTKNISNRHSLERGLSNLIPVCKFTNLIFLCAKNEMGDEILINKINAKINIYKKFNLNCSIHFGYNFGSKLNTSKTVSNYIKQNKGSSIVLTTVVLNQFFLV